MTIDINPIIAGNARFYYANSEEAEPVLRRPFRKAVTASFGTRTLAARYTRISKGSVLWDSTDGMTGVAIPGETLVAGAAITEIEWKPWETNPLSITGTDLPVAGSLYLTANDETVELSLTATGATVAATGYSLPYPDDDDDARILGFVMDLAVGEHLAVRIAPAGGTGGVDGSHANWTELGSNLIMETGVNVALNQTNDFLRVLSDQLPVEQFTTQENFTVSATIYDVSPEALAFLQNRKPVTTEAAVAGDRPGSRVADLERGPRPEKASLAIRMDSTPFLEVGGESQWWFPRVTITSNTTFPIQKTASQVPVQFTVLRSNLYEAAVRFRCQEGEFTI